MEVGGSARFMLWRIGSCGTRLHSGRFPELSGGSLDQIHNSSPTGRANSHPSHSPGEMQSAETRWGKIVNLILKAWPQRRPR